MKKQKPEGDVFPFSTLVSGRLEFPIKYQKARKLKGSLNLHFFQMSLNPINPKPFLKTLLNKPVVVRLKWNKSEYHGELVAIDNYMNLQLDNASEKVNEVLEPVGELFIRCNNVLWIRGDEKSDAEKDETMEA